MASSGRWRAPSVKKCTLPAAATRGHGIAVAARRREAIERGLEQRGVRRRALDEPLGRRRERDLAAVDEATRSRAPATRGSQRVPPPGTGARIDHDESSTIEQSGPAGRVAAVGAGRAIATPARRRTRRAPSRRATRRVRTRSHQRQRARVVEHARATAAATARRPAAGAPCGRTATRRRAGGGERAASACHADIAPKLMRETGPCGTSAG